MARALDRSAEADPSGVRPYEPGDGLRQVSWRQTAHHGELMSLESADGQAPPALVVADTLGARDADALAATTCALLRALRPAPDVLLTDGLAVMRTPVQQERFLAALVPDGEDEGGAGPRARLVGRLAAGGAVRRRVLLVTCDARGPLATALAHGPLGRSVTVVEARTGGAPAAAREGSPEAEKDGAPAAARHAGAAADAPAGIPGELLALLCCCALALLVMVPLIDMIHVGVWVAPVAALLGAGTALGCATGSVLARRGARPVVRTVVAVALAAALLAVGTAICAQFLETRPGAWPDGDATPLDTARTLVATGVAQLGGQPYAEGGELWDLVILLGGTALAALCSALAATRPTRPAVALVPVGVAAADQSVMGSATPAWAALVCALALVLAWLAAPRDRRPVRGALAVLLACALGAAGAVAAPADGTPLLGLGGTRVDTLVDLSRDLQRRSNAVALTYTTTADGPLYLRAAVLDDFDGTTWRASEGTTPLDEPLSAGGGGPGDIAVAFAEVTITTSVTTEGGSSPVPPGTTEVRSTGSRSYVATGPYREPVSSAADVNDLGRLVVWMRARSGGSETPEDLLAVAGEPGENIRAVVSAARADGADAAGEGSSEQLAVVRWLVGYFSAGGFSYSLDAPGGDGQDNLAVIDDFLAERSGYCTHYATAFSVLARLLGVPARVALGYQPGGAAGEDGSYEVTMEQLHAWSEVWIDGYGWVGVDVTPAADDATDEPAETPEAQVTPQTPEETPQEDEPAAPETPEAADDPAAAPEGTDGPAAGPPAWLAPALGGLGVACAAGTAAGLILRAHRRRLVSGDWDYAWRRACRAARHAGVRWERSATEQDVAEAICAHVADPRLAAAVRRLARRACDARYGDGSDAQPADSDGSWVPDLLRALRQ